MKIFCALDNGLEWRINKYISSMSIETGIDDNMKIYCAEMTQMGLLFEKNKSISKFNILISFFKTKDIKKFIPFTRELLIDSGAFSLFNQKKKEKSYDKYFKDYKKFVSHNYNNNLIKGFFELDIDKLIGYDIVQDYRKELFEITDKIIPVWHKELGIEEYKKLCYDYNYISFGCVNDKDIPNKNYLPFVKYAHKYNCKIHGLGMLRPKILNKVPFDSVDGTSWFTSCNFGRINGKKINSDYIKEHQYELTHIQLMKHIKMQEEFYNKWKWYHND